jgi:hypothetical protein
MSLTKATFSMIQGAMFNVLDYGADPTGAADSASAIQAAIAAAQTTKGSVYLPTGAYKINSKLTISAPIGFIGEANLIQNVGDRRGTYLIKGADVIAIEVTTSAGSTLRDFAVVGSGTDTTQGIKLTQCGRSKLERISVVECGSHGIEFNNGNLTSFRDIYVLGNDGDGLLINGAATPNTNAAVFVNIDARGNGGVGFNNANGWNNYGIGITAQQNTGAGVRLDNSRGCDFSVYAEANAAGLDVELTNNANCKGSTIRVVFADSVTDNSNEENSLIRSQNGTDYEPITNIMRFNKVRFPVTTGVTGQWDIFKTTNATYDWHFSQTGATQTIVVKNIAGIADPAVDYPVQSADQTWHKTYHRLTSNLSSTTSILDTWGGWSSYVAPSNATRCSMRADGSNINGTGTYATYSDLRIKENVAYLTDAEKAGQVADIKALNFARFNIIGDDRKMLGLIAQDVEKISPGLVSEDEEGTKTIKQSILHQKAVIALQVALQKIDALEARLSKLETLK